MNDLELYRRKKGLTQGELGVKLGVSKQMVSKWEKGKLFIDPKHWEKLTEILNVSAENLFNNNPNYKPMIKMRKDADILNADLAKICPDGSSELSARMGFIKALSDEEFYELAHAHERGLITIEDIEDFRKRVLAGILDVPIDSEAKIKVMKFITELPTFEKINKKGGGL